MPDGAGRQAGIGYSEEEDYLEIEHNCIRLLIVVLEMQKLDGVGPVDNRPSTDQLHYFDQKKSKKNNLKLDLTPDM